jgi:putative thioredoxin
MASPWIIDVTSEDFEQQCVQRSHTVPVVLDFWAPWCGPCKLLGPLLERLAEEQSGRFVLARVNIDEAQELAYAFAVQAVPTVLALRGGKIVGRFTGLIDEPELRRFLDAIQPPEHERLVAEAAADPAHAEEKLRQALELAPQDAQARIALARLLAEQDRWDEVQQQIAELEARGFLEPEAQELQARLRLRALAAEAGSVEACRAELAQAPQDRNRQWRLAQAVAAAGNYEEAMQLCLELVRQDRHGLGEPARELMVQLFHLLGPDNELASRYRRQLSLALY